MSPKNSPYLYSRLLRYLTGLFAAMGLFCAALAGGTIYLHYRSTLVHETSATSLRFTRLLTQLHEDLRRNSELLSRLHRCADETDGQSIELRDLEVQTFKWFHQAGMELLGSGNKSYWLNRGFLESELPAASDAKPSVFLQRGPEGLIRMVAAVPNSSDCEDATLRMVALRLDDAWLRRVSEFIGAQLALCDDTGRIVGSSLHLPATDLGRLPLTGSDGAIVTLADAPFGLRTFPLELNGERLGHYAILTPANPERSLAFLLSALLSVSLTAALGLMYWITLRLMGRATREVTTLAAWANDFDYASSATPRPPPQGRYRETLALSQAFGDLVRRLDASKAEIEARNLGLERDIAEKTEAIVAQNQLMDLILSELPLGILLAEGSQRLLYANAFAQEVFPLAPGEPLPPTLAHLLAGRESRERTVQEFHFQGRDFKMVAFILERPLRFLLVLEDLTERHAMEERLSQAQKLESVSRLAGGVAHDFNNALASIMPCVDMLRDKIEEPKALSYVDAIEKAALRGADIVRQLLAFSRSGAYNPRKLDLNLAVESAIKLFKPSAKRTLVEWLPGADLPPMRGDESQIQQMLLNIAINALDAMGGGGTLRFETWADRERGVVGVAVTDSGPGVPPETAKLIFDPFFTTKEPGKGTGLGLSVAYGVVQRHQGEIRLAPTEGVGARFEIEFPILDEPEPSAGATPGAKTRANDDDIIIGG